MKKVSSEPIGQRYRATEAVFTYVVVDNDGKPHPLPPDRRQRCGLRCSTGSGFAPLFAAADALKVEFEIDRQIGCRLARLISPATHG